MTCRLAVNRGPERKQERVQCGFGRLPSRLPETPDVTFWMWNERRRLTAVHLWHTLVARSSVLGGVWGSTQVSSSSSLTSSPLSELVSRSRRKSSRMASAPSAPAPDLLQVVGPPVPDLPQGVGSGHPGIQSASDGAQQRQSIRGQARLSLAWLPRGMETDPRHHAEGLAWGVSFRGQCAHRGHRAHPDDGLEPVPPCAPCMTWNMGSSPFQPPFLICTLR